jgi:hypothetical protein
MLPPPIPRQTNPVGASGASSSRGKDVVVVTVTGGTVVVSGMVVVGDSVVVDGISVVVGDTVVEKASSAVPAPSALVSSELLQAAKHRTATAVASTLKARFDRCVG